LATPAEPNPSPSPEAAPGPDLAPKWAWVAAVVALAWVAVARIPLVLASPAHLDSDLAVDGLTLLGATRGNWPWHYPGTPYIGSLPILLSYGQAMIRGVGPEALVSGGVVAYGAVVLATFLMNLRAFGPKVAAWGLIPLAFASTGTTWLSGRITGGHLLAAAWHAAAFAMLVDCLKLGGPRRWATLGLWSGLGLWVDSMFAATGFGLLVGALAGGRPWRRGEGSGPKGRARACLLALAVGSAVGVVPRFVGKAVDPHDSYAEQFEPVTRGDVLAGHAKILALDCLPRLIAGHRLPGFQAEPDPIALPAESRGAEEEGMTSLALAVVVVSLGLFAASCVALIGDFKAGRDPGRSAVRWGLLASGALVLVGFVANRNIFNSDNYRYLVFLIPPWSAGFGLLIRAWSAREGDGKALAWSAALGLAGLMTLDSIHWYQRFGWLDGSYRPVSQVSADPALSWLRAHPEVDAIVADYWDAYRLAFLTGGRVRGVPFPEYPDRFPAIARGLPGGRPRTLIVRAGRLGPSYRARALAEGGREVFRRPGISVVDWPAPGARP